MMKRNIRALIGAVVTAATFTGIPVFAETVINELNISEGLVTVQGSSDATEFLTFEVFTQGEAPSKRNIAGMGEIYDIDRGNFALKFILERSGSFTVRIFDGEEYTTSDFDYVDEQGCADFVEIVQDILHDSETARNKLKECFENPENKAVMNTIGIDFEDFNACPEALKILICGNFADIAGSTTLDRGQVMSIYKGANAVAKMNTDADMYSETVLKSLNMSFENELYTSIGDANKKKWLAAAFAQNAPYTYGELQSAYNKISALYIVNTAKSAEFEEKIKKYSAILGIERDSTYQSYINNAVSTVTRKIVESISISPAYKVNDLLEVIKTAQRLSINNGSGGGSGSSGTSSKGGLSGGLPIINNSTNLPSDENSIVTPDKDNQESVSVFNDVAQDYWAYNAILALKEKNVISGNGYGAFCPENTVTREEFVKMIVCAFGINTNGRSSYFYDVFDDDWFYPYVSAAYEEDIVKGDDKGIFGVHANITRQDAISIAARAIDKKGIELVENRSYMAFGDENMIADYAKDAVRRLYCAGKISGMPDGTMAPNNYCTRAEAAVIIYGLLQ